MPFDTLQAMRLMSRLSKDSKMLTRKYCRENASYFLDDTGGIRAATDIPRRARFVVYQCGFEPLIMAVWSYLDVHLSDDEAEDIARDYLIEIQWFADPTADNSADYVL